MLLIIYIPVTRERESGRSVRIGRENGMEREQEGDLWYPRSGEPRSGNSPHSPLLHLSLSFSFAHFIFLSLRTVPSTQKTRRFIAKERRENVDLSSYVPAWQFVCPRTLRRERLPGERGSRGIRRVRGNERERGTHNWMRVYRDGGRKKGVIGRGSSWNERRLKGVAR